MADGFMARYLVYKADMKAPQPNRVHSPLFIGDKCPRVAMSPLKEPDMKIFPSSGSSEAYFASFVPVL